MTDRITLSAEGLMLEKLVNRALASGAVFQEIRREGRRRMLFVTDTAGAEVLLELAEKYRIDCRVLRRKGLHALMTAARRRITVLIALLLCSVCIGAFLSRVWIIDVQFTGDRPVLGEEAALREALFALGVTPGIARSKIDPDALELQLGAQAENYSFVGVRLQGVRLLVEASPEVEAPELFDIDRSRDLVARCDGVVVSVNVHSGQACVSPGDTVRAGQLLIRGEERVSKEATRGVGALGEVVARTWFTGEAEGSLLDRVRRFTGRESSSSTLRLLDWQVQLSEGEAFELAQARTELLPVGGLFLPLVIERVTLCEYEETLTHANEDALKQSLAAEAFSAAESAMRHQADETCQIVDKWIDYSMIETGRLRARAVLEVHRNIAATRDSLYQGGN